MLHPLVVASRLPLNRALRRKLQHYERATDTILAKCLKESHKVRGASQPKLSLEEAKRMLRGLLGAALARAQEHYGIEVFAVVAMGNHFHIVVRAPQKNLSLAIGYFKARVTEGINLLHGRKGTLWYRRFDAEPILDKEASHERLMYTAVNPVRAGLVASSEEWPGLLLVGGLGDRPDVHFEYLDRTAWHKAGRPSDLSAFFRTTTLHLSTLPDWASMPAPEYRQSLRRSLALQEEEARSAAREEGKASFSLHHLAKTMPEARPRRPKRRQRPYFHGFCTERCKQYINETRIIVANYEERSLCFRLEPTKRGSVRFPPGTYPPAVLLAA